jgi:NADP-dependent aldehyde dehydrogenase
VFGSLIADGFEIGSALVKHENIKAVGFTGSFTGGKALYDLAVNRKEPIPFYGEMSSINPVILLSSAFEDQSLATTIAGSINLGVGQFCTNPGLILTLESEKTNQFCDDLATALSATEGGVMLNKGIHENYEKVVGIMEGKDGISVLGKGHKGAGSFVAQPTVATVSGAGFLANPSLAAEVFGPYSMVVKCMDEDELATVLMNIEGQLTISFMGSEKQIEENEYLITLAEQKAGRVIFNGVPTGVEVCHSMIHGGPFPATTDSKTTSVGGDAIKRFARPVCYQDAPQSILPMELQDENPLNIFRKINGQFGREKV